jgi:hypothetical protein
MSDKPSKKRFAMLALFGLCASVSQAGWICFAPIFGLCEAAYGIGLFSVNYMSMIYMLMFLPMYWPVVMIVDKYGLRKGLLFGIFGTTIGATMRSFINHGFIWAMLG